MPSCETCRFIAGEVSSVQGDKVVREGFCHRLPPKTLTNPDHSLYGCVFPPMRLDMWCGEYRLSFKKWWRRWRRRG